MRLWWHESRCKLRQRLREWHRVWRHAGEWHVSRGRGGSGVIAKPSLKPDDTCLKGFRQILEVVLDAPADSLIGGRARFRHRFGFGFWLALFCLLRFGTRPRDYECLEFIIGRLRMRSVTILSVAGAKRVMGAVHGCRWIRVEVGIKRVQTLPPLYLFLLHLRWLARSVSVCAVCLRILSSACHTLLFIRFLTPR